MGIIVLVERVTEKQLPRGSAELLLNIWIYFNIVGNNVLLPILVITFLFSKRAKRHPTLVNLCITWIFSGIFSLLLFYAKQHVGPDPDPSLCVTQASLLYGIIPMWSVAVLALVYYMLSSVREHSSPSNAFSMAIVLASPYVAQCSFTIAALILSIQNPKRVNRHQAFFFCSLFHVPLFFAMSLFTLLMCAIIMILEVALAVVIYRKWRTRRSAGLPNQLPTPLVVRVLIFGVYVGLGVVVNILSMFSMSFAANIFAATAGTVVFLIFGTQADVFRTWCFWKKSDDEPPISPQILSKTPVDGPYPASLEAIFRSPQSGKKSSWSDRPYRPLSVLSIKRSSARRSSTKNFVRLSEDGSNELFPGQNGPTRQVAERQRVNIQVELEAADAQRLPRRSKLEEQMSIIRIAASDGGRKPENARKRRKWDLPRPKGPRKNISAMNIMSTADSFIARPPTAALRPFGPVLSTSADSSRTLGAGTINTMPSS